MDPIANMLTSIRNSSAIRRTYIRVPYSSLKQRVADVLREEGYVGPVTIVEEGPGKLLEITLRYDGGTPNVRGVERVSKPSRRWYVRKQEIPHVLSGLGVAVLSTPQGIMTDKEARKKGIGGEVICTVW